MPRAKKGYQPKVQLLDMPLPFTGLDLSFPLATQRPGTTPIALNVRGFNANSGRRALSRRRGQIKYLQNRISGSSNLQELAELIGTGYVSGGGAYIPGSVPSGNIVVGLTGDAGGTVAIYGPPTTISIGASAVLIHKFGPTANSEQVGGIAVDPPSGGPAAFIYVYSWASHGSFGITGYVTKYTTAGVQVWRRTIYDSVGGSSPSNPGFVAAPVVYGGNVYVNAGVSDTALVTVALPGLYRIKASDGSDTSTNPWISGEALYAAGPGTGGTGSPQNYCASQMPTSPVVSTDVNGVPYIAIPQVNGTTGRADISMVFVRLTDGVLTSQANILAAAGITAGTGAPNGGTLVDSIISGGSNFYADIRYEVGVGPQWDNLVILAFTPPSGIIAWNSGVLATGTHSWGPDLNTYYAASGIVYDAASGNVVVSGATFSGARNAATGVLASLTAPISGSTALSTFAGYYATIQGAQFLLFFPDTRSYNFSPSGLLPFIALLENGVGVGTFTGSPLTITNYQRQVTLVGVSAGTVDVAYAGYWQSTINGFQALSQTQQVIRSDSLLGNLYFADGVNFKYYQPSTNTVVTLVASSGSLPVDSNNNAPRLVAVWNGRLVYSGLPGDPNNWFMSAQGDATNWNYNPSPTVETQAVAGNNAPSGKVGDVVTALIPYNDDVLIFGGDHTIWQMTGDPMAGGRIDRISDITGIAWGNAWCKTPDGGIYFFGSRGSVYFLNFSAVAAAEGKQLNRVSQAIDQPLSQLNMANVVVRMAYDDRWQGLHVYISDLTGAASTHYYYDEATQSWWSDTFGSTLFNPFCSLVFDGDVATDRTILLGGQDGWVRSYSNSALDDDGIVIASNVLIGPNGFKGGWEYLLNDIQADIDLNGGSVNWSIQPGFSAQVALAAAGLSSGVFGVGRNHSQAVRAAGIACYVNLSRSVAELPWAIESLRGKITVYPHTRQRVF